VMRDSHHRVRIPLAAGVDSLNIATSAAIALYALINAQPARLRDRPRF
jgi:tRNA G18 (ribose-2'-O)-methylase SpoU